MIMKWFFPASSVSNSWTLPTYYIVVRRHPRPTSIQRFWVSSLALLLFLYTFQYQPTTFRVGVISTKTLLRSCECGTTRPSTLQLYYTPLQLQRPPNPSCPRILLVVVAVSLSSFPGVHLTRVTRSTPASFSKIGQSNSRFLPHLLSDRQDMGGGVSVPLTDLDKSTVTQHLKVQFPPTRSSFIQTLCHTSHMQSLALIVVAVVVAVVQVTEDNKVHDSSSSV